MQSRSRLSFINSKKLGRSIFSSYDNDTFVPDQEFEIVKRKTNSLDDIIAEKDNEEEYVSPDNVSNGTDITVSNGCSEYDTNYSHKSTKNTRNVTDLNDIQNASGSENVSDISRNKNKLINEPSETDISSSDDVNSSSQKTKSGAQRTNEKLLRKPRSFSDTQDPILCHHLTICEINDSSGEKCRQTDEISNADHIPTNDNACNEAESKEATPQPAAEPKRNRRWMRKLARYATFDEGSVYLAKASKSPLESLPNETLDQALETDENNPPDTENETKENQFQRKRSTSKIIRQSMSNGFSKFKQLSISGKNGSRKIDQEYSMINNDVYCHETSKRLVPLETTELMPTIFNVSSTTEASNMLPLPGNLLRRCSSLPECLDATSICDEELDELYLPRRMAICPDLAVPAMKQLRTYLVLTRLKQYCIV